MKKIKYILLLIFLAVSILTFKLITSVDHEALTSSGVKSDVLCGDHLDNDGDGLVDCDDTDCCWAPVCWPRCGGDPHCSGDDWVVH